jgi:hypothetical protein
MAGITGLRFRTGNITGAAGTHPSRQPFISPNTFGSNPDPRQTAPIPGHELKPLSAAIPRSIRQGGRARAPAPWADMSWHTSMQRGRTIIGHGDGLESAGWQDAAGGGGGLSGQDFSGYDGELPDGGGSPEAANIARLFTALK